MKKLILLTALIIMSCSTDSEESGECNCDKLTYEVEQSVVINPINGLPQLTFTEVLLNIEPVVCQDEKEVQLPDNIFYVIECE